MRDTIEMAREAGFDITYDPTESPPQCFVEAWEDQLKAFEAIVRADEREACAKVCEQKDEEFDEGPDQWVWHSQYYAAAIRAR
jgi:hypothetical protein